jgi:hypothetical protein
MTMRDKIAKIVACRSGTMATTSALIAALPDYDAQQARITELERELGHCIYELNRADSRKPHRNRRAGLARAVLKVKET